MNKIEIFKPFEEAYELMKRILFQPFDLKKWLVIGFTAWLASLGAGFNFRFNYNRNSKVSDLNDIPAFRAINETLQQTPWWLIAVGIAVLAVLFLALIVLFAWLRARGRFMFIDCVVKNRGAVSEPWREFRSVANSYFLFSLVIGCALGLFIMLLSLLFLVPLVRGAALLRLHEVYLISTVAVWVVALVVLVVVWSLVSHFMVMIMYRRRCGAIEALRASLSLIASYPGEITLYVLFWIVIVIGSAIVACLAVCLTCCLAAIPYVGTVILLPIFVLFRAFGLLFARQFGPDYDVWAGAPLVPENQPPPLPPPLPA